MADSGLGVIRDPRGARSAGGACMRVQLLVKEGLAMIYLFEVFVHDVPYWVAAAGYPFRDWAVRDVYREGQESLYRRHVYEETAEFLEWEPTRSP